MAKPRNLYVRDRDVECYQLAEQLAYQDRISLSDLVARLLREHLEARGVSLDDEEARVPAKAAP
jgi:hypothetical protein